LQNLETIISSYKKMNFEIFFENLETPNTSKKYLTKILSRLHDDHDNRLKKLKNTPEHVRSFMKYILGA
jgi:hypothetical protein